MKIRIKGDSLRYRLTKTDVNTLATTGYVEEQTNFGAQVLIYALQRYEGMLLSATFQHNKITMLMPNAMADEWILTDRVGFEYLNQGLFLLVEKDFKCLDSVNEDQSDNYANPNGERC